MKLNMYGYVRHSWIQSLSIDELEKFQPDVEMGSKILLEKLDAPVFTDTLLQLQSSTILSPHDLMVQNLEIGHALPKWGSGKNPPQKKPRIF